MGGKGSKRVIRGGRLENPQSEYVFKLSKEDRDWLAANPLPRIFLPCRMLDFSEFLNLPPEQSEYTQSNYISSLFNGRSLIQYLQEENPFNWPETELNILVDNLGGNGRIFTFKELVTKYRFTMYRIRSILYRLKKQLREELTNGR
jgi:hypothetical protein